MLSELSTADLSQLVDKYPWYAGARKELCSRLFEGGDRQWKKDIFARNMMYMPDRSVLYNLYLAKKDLSKPVDILLDKPKKKKEYKTDPRVAKSGDFFSQEDYASTAQGEYTFHIGSGKASADGLAEGIKVEFFTETLAEIYANQGYIAQARQIYNQLLLANPEKSAYFATLIENLNENIQ